MGEPSKQTPQRAPLNLLEAAAGVDGRAMRRWDQLSRGLEAIFPGEGARIVAHAQRHALNPVSLDRITPASADLPCATVWFSDPERGNAAATVHGVHYLRRRT